MHLGVPSAPGPEAEPDRPSRASSRMVREGVGGHRPRGLRRGGRPHRRPDGLAARRVPVAPVRAGRRTDRRSDAVLSQVTDDEARRIRAEQSTVVALEPERAIETLPRLLADRRDREHLIDLMERAAAMVELNADQVAMLDRIRRVLTPAGAVIRGNGRPGRDPRRRPRRRHPDPPHAQPCRPLGRRTRARACHGKRQERDIRRDPGRGDGRVSPHALPGRRRAAGPGLGRRRPVPPHG